MNPLEETPAEVADSYTEQIKASRANESHDVRPIRHISTAMIEFIEEVKTYDDKGNKIVK